MTREYTITIGTHKDAEELRHALQDGGCRISGSANDILSKIVVSRDATELDLAVVSVEELGLAERVTRKEIYDRAQDSDLDLCPAETGPQLCLQHKDQLDEPQLFIGMEPLTVSSGDVEVFQVGRYGPSVFLGSWNGAPDSIFLSGQSWLFVRRPITNA